VRLPRQPEKKPIPIIVAGANVMASCRADDVHRVPHHLQGLERHHDCVAFRGVATNMRIRFCAIFASLVLDIVPG